MSKHLKAAEIANNKTTPAPTEGASLHVDTTPPPQGGVSLHVDTAPPPKESSIVSLFHQPINMLTQMIAAPLTSKLDFTIKNFSFKEIQEVVPRCRECTTFLHQ